MQCVPSFSGAIEGFHACGLRILHNIDAGRRKELSETCLVLQVGATDSEDEADTAEDLQRIEAAAAAISQRLQQTSPIRAHDEIQVGTSGSDA